MAPAPGRGASETEAHREAIKRHHADPESTRDPSMTSGKSFPLGASSHVCVRLVPSLSVAAWMAPFLRSPKRLLTLCCLQPQVKAACFSLLETDTLVSQSLSEVTALSPRQPSLSLTCGDTSSHPDTHTCRHTHTHYVLHHTHTPFYMCIIYTHITNTHTQTQIIHTLSAEHVYTHSHTHNHTLPTHTHAYAFYTRPRVNIS